MNIHPDRNMKTNNRASLNPFITAALKTLIVPLLIVLAGCGSLQKREARYVSAVERARPFIEGRQDYDMALIYLDNLQSMCVVFASDSHSSDQEKERWQERAGEIQKARQIFVSEYNASLKQVRTLAFARQSEFVCLQATKDLRAAKGIADGQNGKWFNWFGLRDDPSEWAKAAILCDRVLGDTRISHILNLAAARQKYDCEHRLGNRGRNIYADLHKLPGYDTFSGFPTPPSEEEINSSAKKIWSQTGRPMPLLKGESSDVVPSMGTGYKLASASR
jgi:hypothetical protein